MSSQLDEVPITYYQDRAAIDIGLHFFVDAPGNNYKASNHRVGFRTLANA